MFYRMYQYLFTFETKLLLNFFLLLHGTQPFQLIYTVCARCRCITTTKHEVFFKSKANHHYLLHKQMLNTTVYFSFFFSFYSLSLVIRNLLVSAACGNFSTINLKFMLLNHDSNPNMSFKDYTVVGFCGYTFSFCIRSQNLAAESEIESIQGYL